MKVVTITMLLGLLINSAFGAARPGSDAEKATEAVTLPGAPDGHYVVMQFETSFANKKAAMETVTFMLEKDGKWRAAGYFIK